MQVLEGFHLHPLSGPSEPLLCPQAVVLQQQQQLNQMFMMHQQLMQQQTSQTQQQTTLLQTSVNGIQNNVETLMSNQATHQDMLRDIADQMQHSRGNPLVSSTNTRPFK